MPVAVPASVESQLKIVIFGLALSSSWGNGHASLLRGLCRALSRRGHRISFFERDVPYYAAHRDLTELHGTGLTIYPSWDDVLPLAKRALADADAAIVTSYCPDGIAASQLVLDSPSAVRVFYDLDTPVTLDRADRGLPLDCVPPDGLGGFDLVLSFTGGRALDALEFRFGARLVLPLYGSVDPATHHPRRPIAALSSDLSYLGTFAADRQPSLEELFVNPARRLPGRKFVLAGAQYPEGFPWQQNIFHFDHLPPAKHPALYSSSRVTLNVTRAPVAKLGYCPSGRLFEAAACGAPVLSDTWEGLDQFFTPGAEILLAATAEDTMKALELSDLELRRVAKAARERTLEEHTTERRAEQLERILLAASRGRASPRRQQPRAPTVWGIIPAAGACSRIQPPAFSKELLPIGLDHPRAVTELLLERMLRGGASRVSFVISAGKSDILEYFGGSYGDASLCYCVQPSPAGLCDALFRSIPLIHADDEVLVGLPDTVWFPENGFKLLSEATLSLLLFPVPNPEAFNAVILDDAARVLEIQVKQPGDGSRWVWGAFRLPGRIFHELHALWIARERRDELVGTLINAWILGGGHATGVRAGESYADVGTPAGYREALRVLGARRDGR